MQKRINLISKFLILALFTSGCAQFKTRSQIPQQKTNKEDRQKDQPFESQADEQIGDGDMEEDGFQEPPPPIPQKKSSPKLGLILGAGGARTFAHAGVLKILDNERIPVHAIVGLEWGALLAGIYAQDGRVHNLDWKLYKLSDNDLPGQSLLSKAFSKDNVSTMSSYLKTVFETSKIEKAKVPFACPSISTQSGSMMLVGRGQFKAAVESCLPYPPLFASKNSRFAEPLSVEQSAQWLRRQGAEVIVFVDVLSDGDIWTSSNLPSDESSRLLWWEVRRRYRGKIPGVDEVITVPVGKYGIGEFAKRKTIGDVGQGAGRELSRRLLQRYNF